LSFTHLLNNHSRQNPTKNFQINQHGARAGFKSGTGRHLRRRGIEGTHFRRDIAAKAF
jgi:hypothetical protein